MNEYRSGQSADQVHSALKSALSVLEKAQQCAVLWFGEIIDHRAVQTTKTTSPVCVRPATSCCMTKT